MNPFTRVALIAAATLSLAACDDAAKQTPATTVTVENAEIRMVGTSGMATFTLTAHGGRDMLLEIDAGELGPAVMHKSEVIDGIARMRPMEVVELPADETVKFETGANHVMIVPMANAPEAGQTAPITLRFQTAQPVTVDAVMTSMDEMISHDGKAH